MAFKIKKLKLIHPCIRNLYIANYGILSCAALASLFAVGLPSGCSQKSPPKKALAKRESHLEFSGSPPEAPTAPKKASQKRVLNSKLLEYSLKGYAEGVKLALNQGAEIEATNENGATALMLAAFNGHTEIVKFLLDKGASVNRRDAMGRTALMYAASGPFPETVRVLIDHGADLNIQDKGEGWTALMFAASEGHLAVVKVLVEAGALTEITDQDGDKAVDFAYRKGHREVFDYLRKNRNF